MFNQSVLLLFDGKYRRATAPLGDQIFQLGFFEEAAV